MESENFFNDQNKSYANTNYMYVNSAAVATGDNDFVVKVETNLPEGIGEELNLLLSPRVAKQIRNALNSAISDYEEIVGEIYLDNKIVENYESTIDDREN